MCPPQIEYNYVHFGGKKYVSDEYLHTRLLHLPLDCGNSDTSRHTITLELLTPPLGSRQSNTNNALLVVSAVTQILIDQRVSSIN
jgi:hypothetical protein